MTLIENTGKVFQPGPIVVVDDPGQLKAFLVTMCSTSMLYVQLHGHRLSRHGDLSLITIRAYPHKEVHVIDAQALGAETFTAKSVFGLTLQSIFENPRLRKCFWDVRDAADAMWAHHQVSLQGVIDLQLFENACRHCPGMPKSESQTYVRSLETAIGQDLQLPPEELIHNARLRRAVTLRLPSTAFRLRPLDQETIEYCASGVCYLPELYLTYIDRVTGGWLPKIKEETMRRVHVPLEEKYDPDSPSKALGPWGSGKPKRAGPLFR
ncbi:hypothetical protein SEUCBS139899_007947 [Sporothrix eucalyptigena]|uniref:3'-5' exonuclease domain-containing protein n=1 Tax=Sporothrix eucalyptigena TaxID=1812306 RepID=A0ABP0AU97_9PEZI